MPWQAQRGSTDMVPLILNLNTTSGVWPTSRPGPFIPGKETRHPL